MKTLFYKTGELNGSSFVKIPLRSSAILIIQNNDKYCFLWSKLAHLHPCDNSNRTRVKKISKYFNEVNSDGFVFKKRFECSDVQKLNELIILSVNIYEINFYQDVKIWKHILYPIEISKKDSDRVLDLLVYKNHYALNKILHVFLGSHNKSLVCRRCLTSYTIENALLNHKEEKCGDDNICTIRTSSDSHLFWKKHFHKSPLYFRIIADFEAENEIDNSDISNKTTNIHEQNEVFND